ncbi:MAG: sigma-54 dependent transcriptional regulator [Spirochaetaceae bacterium]|jgi:DNA-binding NtrC family response regulator|nr:sigma-54 dependent transcriptional regulator [Spirochaetaceae bacterium]
MDKNQNTIVLIDDESSILVSLEMILNSEGFNSLKLFDNGQEGLEFIRSGQAAVVVLDLNMPEVGGEEILKIIKNEQPLLPVIIITGMNDLTTAIEIMKMGAFDFLTKPNDISRVAVTVQNAIKLGELQKSLNQLKKEFFKDDLAFPDKFSHILSRNKSMLKIFHFMEAISHTTQPVLITGETGVGKELFARALHSLSNKSGDFVPVDVSCYDGQMLTDILFGHVKGAYTGADINRGGLVKAAKSGSLFLDEIGDLNFEAQSVLLRFIQEREYRQGGDDKLMHSDAKIILATNRNLPKLVEEGKFRKDLFYRLETHNISIPPLRKRTDDLYILVEYFIYKTCKELDKDLLEIPPGFINRLEEYSFPGNVRELQNLIFNAVTVSKNGMISFDSISDKIDKSHKPDNTVSSYKFITGFELPTLKEAEQLLIDEALRRTDNHQGNAAELLGISRQALNKRIRLRYEQD